MRVARLVFVLLATMTIMVFSFICFAADDDILNYIPAMVKAQTTINPVGTYTGSGIVTMGNCACTITGAIITVENGPITDSYILSYSGVSTTDCVSTSGQCSWTDSMSNLPAAMKNKELIYGGAAKGSYVYSGDTYTTKTTITGSIDFSGSSPIFIENSAWQVTGPTDENYENAYDALLRLTLQKNS